MSCLIDPPSSFSAAGKDSRKRHNWPRFVLRHDYIFHKASVMRFGQGPFHTIVALFRQHFDQHMMLSYQRRRACCGRAKHQRQPIAAHVFKGCHTISADSVQVSL